MVGAGSMGQVFEAHDRDLNRRVALKAVYASSDREALRREAQGIAAIRHHGVVTVHALGEHRGVHYLVMELLSGETLAARLAQRRVAGVPLALHEALDVLASIADVLAAVHHAGVAHRDVKPSNIVLSVGGRVVLTDFGILAAERYVSRDARIVGTVEYMAPETIVGNVAPGMAYLVDLYAFGVVAFETLTGHLPFEADSATRLMQRHLSVLAPMLSGFRSDIPGPLDVLVRELLAKDPLDRPQSMESVAQRLRAPAVRTSIVRSAPPPRTSVMPSRASVMPSRTSVTPTRASAPPRGSRIPPPRGRS
jgi:serine/threonine-protein kinase